MDFDAARPIWRQLLEEFSRRIAVAAWGPGERIPGVRELAADVGVNPNTVQRALSELEREGLARSVRTAGRFVTDETERIKELRRDLAKDAADTYIRDVTGLALTRDDAQRLVAERWTLRDTDEDAITPRTGNTHSPHVTSRKGD